MKLTLLVCLILGVSLTLSHPVDHDYEQQWQRFKMSQNREFESEHEELIRKNIFEKNARMVHQHNMQHERGLESFTMKLNKFSDWTEEEMDQMMDHVTQSDENEIEASQFPSTLDLSELPDRLDWREHNLVTSVKNQNSCGACYAFSALGAVEAQIAKKTGKDPVSLSVQNIVDCAGWHTKYHNFGCGGGKSWKVFNYIMDYGVDTEESYPYIDKNTSQTCNYKEESVGARISGYKRVIKGDEADLMKALVTVGPVSVAIDSKHDSFHQYSGGVFYDSACRDDILTHVILLVGYGTENGQDYWLVKNSWDTNWGEDGYGKIRRNINHCGIASLAYYPYIL